MGKDNIESQIRSSLIKKRSSSGWRAPLHESKMTIFELIKSDHEQILNLCRNIQQHQSARSDEVWEMFVELKELITLHTKAEEIVFYNTLHDRSIESQDDELRFDVMEGFEEHHMVQLLLAEIAVLSRNTDRWMAKMRVLAETLQRHIEKEENDMFSNAQRDLDKEESQSLALEFLREKDLLKSGH